ncbi:efflux RND transporter periplasmic adaptor subunit [Halomonas sp. PAMB 3264]|uniref:efflux RND transporter periplasmic adaptor subunit n=1 Tax=Halomonas sp. PAMB 3264 TaxID=3075222 RepID=UPI0028970015|nr:efflux RND transporter periplasmic adaptor subunit [Halomonas sp. PAMB 3264]WNL43490.1 efflux RND transporter periplasmic adaptor subunit [Halomonas sp. PAMB 3264]
MRRIPFSYALALLFVLALTVWLAFGDFQRFQSAPPDAAAEQDVQAPRVEVTRQQSTPYVPQEVFQGQLEARQEALLRANVAGYVVEKPVAQGDAVRSGETLLVLDNQALPERLRQARAELAVAEAEYAGAQDLRQRNFISQPDLLRLQSGVSASTAQVAQLERELADTRPTAPFAGVLDRVQVELGDLLQPGEEWGRLIDDRTLTGTAWVSQQQINRLSVGLPVTARLLSGESLEGEVAFISSRAEEQTRSFYMEVTLDNPERKRLAGSSAEFTLTLPPRQAHALSPALLSLDDNGELSVKHLGENDTVVQTPVTLLSATLQSAFVAGLPETLELITLGAGLVEPGETVTPVRVEDTDQRTPATGTIAAGS